MSEEEIRKMCSNIYEGEDWQPMIDFIQKQNNEINKLKEGLYKILKLNRYMINCSSQKVIYKFLIKQWYLIYEVLGEIAPGLASCSKESDK